MFNINKIISYTLDFGMAVNYCEYETNSWYFSNETTSAVVTPGGWLIVNGREAVIESLTFKEGALIIEGSWKSETTFLDVLKEFCHDLAHSENGIQQDYKDIVDFWFQHHSDIKALDFEDQVEWTHFLDFKKYQGDDCSHALYEAMYV